MANYKTPGVYVEEITKFPPSVAQVETAIPAFIGYTEKAEKLNGDSLELVPTRITSLLEYETFFGGADLEDSITVEITDVVDSGVVDRTIKVNQPTTPSDYKMFYSLQMYFANGGGPCYIVSVADYDTLVSKSDLSAGLTKIRKEDEPTLLLFPDATSLATDSDFWAIYNDALTQCNELQDRFTIIDTYSDDDHLETSSGDTVPPEEALRNGMTSEKDYAKYGAAYYPFLETILDYAYAETSVSLTHVSNGSTALDSVLADAEAALANLNSASTGNAALVTAYTDADTALQAMVAVDALANKGTVSSTVQDMVDAIDDVISEATDAAAAATAAAAAAEENTTIADAATAAAAAITAAIAGGSAIGLLKTALEAHITAIDGSANGTDAKTNSAAAAADMAAVAAQITAIIALVDPTTIDAIVACQGVDTDGILNGLKLSAIETLDNATYNLIKSKINDLPLTLPPSSAMAGIYARIDSTRGVWKAPANVNVSYVIKPSVQVSHEEQGDLNVHTTGKSINAIRSFTGKGTLVWGARTLAGNDNEWRYVPVRRFFNMVEESVSKASEQFVFEGNDANTWVRIRAMIENFLILQWKAGALAGSKAEQAFYVRVGLGQTMTAQDILEGRMIIEIGMAVVRPAEFIILRFSHKMQEA